MDGASSAPMPTTEKWSEWGKVLLKPYLQQPITKWIQLLKWRRKTGIFRNISSSVNLAVEIDHTKQYSLDFNPSKVLVAIPYDLKWTGVSLRGWGINMTRTRKTMPWTVLAISVERLLCYYPICLFSSLFRENQTAVVVFLFKRTQNGTARADG